MVLVEEGASPHNTSNGYKTDTSLLSEEKLRQIGKNIPATVFTDGDDSDEPSNEVQELRLSLFHTAHSNNLSPSHGAAAVNALCGFLDVCSRCQSRQWRSLCFCRATCEQLFYILRSNSERFKGKIIKQLLITLVKILSTYPDEGERLSLTTTLVVLCVDSLTSQENPQSIRVSMQALESLLNKNLISAESIVRASMGSPPVSLDDVNNDPIEYNSKVYQAAVEKFIASILHWAQYADCVTAISRFLPCFLSSLNACRAARMMNANIGTTMQAPDAPCWIGPVTRSLTRDISLLESFGSHVLPGLLRLDLRDTEVFLRTLPLDDLQQGKVRDHTDADIQLCLMAVRVLGSGIEVPGEDALKGQLARYFDPVGLSMTLIEHSSANIRIAAFSLALSASPSSVPLPRNFLVCLQECLPNFHQETHPRTRNEFLALMKTLCLRLGNAAKIASNPVAMTYRQQQVLGWENEILLHHIEFARWYQYFLYFELRPTASYQSHITALKVLPLVIGNSDLAKFLPSDHKDSKAQHQHGVPERHAKALDHVRSLLDLLVDPFDDVRESAFSLLSLILPGYERSDSTYKSDYRVNIDDGAMTNTENALYESIQIALTRAEDHLRRSGRAYQADGVGRLYAIRHLSVTASRCSKRQGTHPFSDLLLTLENTLAIEGHDQVQALMSTPLHGYLIALRIITSQYTPAENAVAAYTRLLACCGQVWNAVHSILCFDAPEGRQFHEEEDEDDDGDSGSKDILSFCWRALKESSLLMHALVDRILSRGQISSPSLPAMDYSIYGQLLFTQLAELRHRGAFSTVAQTYAAWCIMCSESGDPIISNLSKEWYQEILACIQQQASALTRRSAGLPAMVTGILAAFPRGPFFDDVVLDLQAIADTTTENSEEIIHVRLPQVHALNCLKDIFTDARFGPSTEEHLTTSLGIAIESLESRFWAIRNCGLMLLKALLGRLNNGSDTRTRTVSSRRQLSPLMYEKYPILPGLLLKLLNYWHDGDASPVNAQRVFPALEIVQRFGIPKSYQEEILQALERQRSSSMWLLRQKAAKACGSNVGVVDILDPLQQIIGIGKILPQNEVHGQLLSLRIVLMRDLVLYLETAPKNQRELFTWLPKLYDQYITTNTCPMTTATALDILVEVATHLIHLKDDPDVLHFLELSKQVMLVNYKSLQPNDLSQFPVHSLEFDSLLNGMAALQDVKVITSKRISDTFDETLGLEKPLPSILDFDLARMSDQQRSAGPSEYKDSLQSYGGQVGQQFLDAGKPTSEYMAWIKTLLLAGDGYSEMATRLAAVASIDAFVTSLRKDGQTSASVILPVELMTILYDTLVDDDDDVRSHGASVVSAILSAEGTDHLQTPTRLSLSPPSARLRFLQYLLSTHNQSMRLVLEAVWRLLGLTPTTDVVRRVELMRMIEDGVLVMIDATNLQLKPVSALLENATREQDVVFEEEKQNLYIDPVTEAESWAQVLVKIEPEIWPPGLAETLSHWTAQGLRILCDELDKKGDGPLGLTSKADVFALFMQVLAMTDALLIIFRSNSLGIPVHDDSMSTILLQLETLSKIGQEKALHPLIIHKAQTIIRKANVDSK